MKDKVEGMRRCLGVILCLVFFFSDVFPQAVLADEVTKAQLNKIEQQWQTSAHALAEVNCSSCHQNEETKAFISQPTEESCKSCHENSVETFLLGKTRYPYFRRTVSSNSVHGSFADEG